MPTPPPRQQPSFTIVAPRIHPYATADGEENDDDEGYISVARASITHDEDISPLATRSEPYFDHFTSSGQTGGHSSFGNDSNLRQRPSPDFMAKTNSLPPATRTHQYRSNRSAMCMDNDTKRSTTPDDKYAFTTKC